MTITPRQHHTNPLATGDLVTLQAVVDMNQPYFTGWLARQSAAEMREWIHALAAEVGITPSDEQVSATGADAGTPGTFTPENATPPPDLLGMTGITANPATAWAEGEHVVLGDESQAHWTATQWAAGAAPAPIGRDRDRQSSLAAN
jgi:hypothetical protein